MAQGAAARQTVTELLRHRAEHQPERVAFRFLDYSASAEPIVSAFSYAGLEARSRDAAAALRAVGSPGDRVLLLCSPGLDYIAYYFGCMHAGMVAVPAFPPSSSRSYDRIDAIAKDCGASIVLCDDVDADKPEGAENGLSGDAGDALSRARWLSVRDRSSDGAGQDLAPADAGPDTLAFLQYTSGSTSTPKGVMVSHGNLLANARAIEGCFGFGEDTPSVNWVPLYHDMGLIGGVIAPLYSGFPSAHMAPSAFIRSPQRWLEAITAYQAVMSTGPDFAYQLCVDRVGPEAKQSLDLSAWTRALNGSEPVRAQVLDAFAEAFAECGFRKSSLVPCYGLAENTLVVSGKPANSGDPIVRYVAKAELEQGVLRPPTDLAQARPLVSSGRVAPAVDVEIVDPQTGRRSAPDRVGEIWVRGASVAGGYLNAPQATENAFHRTLADAPDQRYLRTGDLGALIDGELFVTGRADDLMIFHGRNVYPQDVEAASIGSDPVLASTRCAAFAVEGEGGEAALVVVQELPRRRIEPARHARIAAAIRRRITEEHQVALHALVLARPGGVPTTSSGKVQRKMCRARFLDGQYPAPITIEAAPEPDEAPTKTDTVATTPAAPAAQPVPGLDAEIGVEMDIEHELRLLISQAAGCDIRQVSASEPFATYGLDSVRAVDIARRLSERLGREVPVSIAWDHPTIASAANWLTASGKAVTRIHATERAARERITIREDAAHEPIAVVGIGCRFPGGADTPEAYWNLILSGQSAVTPIPPDRWNNQHYYHPDPDTPGHTYAQHAAFINHVRAFDHTLFGITPREARTIDPQHRLILETTWHALEHAHTPPTSLHGTNTGVYIGMGRSDYDRISSRDESLIDGYLATGVAANFAANRLSYTLGLQGPSLIVDTACSSSLVATHLAVQALRHGECDTAITGGVNLILSPDSMIALTKGRMLSPTGACHTFDNAADGYVRGEGAGIIILKTLTKALHDHNTIHALILGTATNQDGASAGITVPRGPAQEDVIRRALADARISADAIGYVETHGTGTPLGDPIELRALTHALNPTQPLHIGTAKTTIGHLEAAAGIASLIKTILTLKHATIPPHPLNQPNPHLPQNPHLTIPQTPTPWTQTTRTAGTSSFGFGGTNAHLILQNHHPQPETEPTPEPAPQQHTPHTITLSAATPTALANTAKNLHHHLQTQPTPLPALAYATTHTRTTHPHRATITTTNHTQLTHALHALTTNTPHPHTTQHHHPTNTTTHITYLIPGHGTSLRGTLAGLYGIDPTITESLDSAVAALGADGPSALDLLVKPADPAPSGTRAPEDPRHTHPALCAMAFALAAWWRARGVVPDSVLGHSAGAYPAAALAGILDEHDAMRLSALRAQLVADLPGDGAMAAVFCEPERLAELDPIVGGDVVIALYNSPRETVIAGPTVAVEKTMALVGELGLRSTRLRTPVAFHTAQVDPMLDPLREAFSALALRSPRSSSRPVFISDTTGLAAGAEVADPEYWVRHAREPVRFDKALATAHAQGSTILIELGPGGLLPLAAAAANSGTRPTLISALSRTAEPPQHLAEALARAWAAGADVDWSAVYQRPAIVPDLPLYPFDRNEFWITYTDPAPVVVSNGNGNGNHRNGSVRVGDLTHRLRVELSTVLGLDRPEELGIDAGLFDLGLTSAMIVQVRTALERELGRQLPTTVVFDHPTIRKLAEHLADEPRIALQPYSTHEPHAANGHHHTHQNGVAHENDIVHELRTSRLPSRASTTALARRTIANAAEPLAIVGMACRLPGGANDLDAYWRLLEDGRDAIRDVPEDRWDADAFYDLDPAAPGKTYSRQAGFLDTPVDRFDAAAFGISPREALSMDPQQRLLLEVAWEALEDAGCDIATIEDSATAVYLGINTSDYLQLLLADPAASGADPYLATGNTFSVAAGRLSHFLGAQGPSMAIDTACSSSLVAAHTAARALRSGEADLAIVAGVSLMISPTTTVGMAKLHALSPDGRCKTFSADADGYGRGEGCGVVVLKRLSDARAAGDRIWALMRGSAVNQDGRSAGLTVPNGRAQTAVIRAALRDAGVNRDAVSYVEAHGTGTPLGDPLEIEALVEALRTPQQSADSPSTDSLANGSHPANPLWVGSVKTNIGHLEAAAGISGLIKAALALHNGRIPAHLHAAERPSPHIAWDELPIRIPERSVEWQTSGTARIAGVSAFGFSGTNAHVLLEQAPIEPAPAKSAPAAPAPEEAMPRLLVLSAHTPEALDAAAASYRDLLGHDRGTVTLTDVAHSAAIHRTHLPHRMSIVAASAAQAASRLSDAAAGKRVAGVRRGINRWDGSCRVIAVYSGQGSQWPGMGRALDLDPAAASIIDRCDAVVRDLAGWSLRDELLAPREQSRLDDTAFAQPAIFAVQAALTELWRAWGVAPEAVIGHSVGEVAAAYAAGFHSLEAACEIALRRGQAMAAGRGLGAMAAVGLDRRQTTELIAPYGDALAIAAVNSPRNTVVAGDRAALDRLEAEVRSRGAFWSMVQQEYAFHTGRMAAYTDRLQEALAPLNADLPGPATPTTPAYSTVTGKAAESGSYDAAYWTRNIVQPVLFQDALHAAVSESGSESTGQTVVIEIGGHPVLSTIVSQCLDGRRGPSGRGTDVTALSSMRTRDTGLETMLDAAGALHVLGYRLDHARLQPATGRRVQLPTYAWQRERYWIPKRPTANPAPQSPDGADKLDDCMYEVAWREAAPRAAQSRDAAVDSVDAVAAGTWVLVADSGARVAQRLAARLESAGHSCVIVPPSSISPDDGFAAVASAIAEAATAATPEANADQHRNHDLRGLIHLGALGADPTLRTPGQAWDDALAISCGPLLTAPQALLDAEPAASSARRLWTVTRGAVPADDAPLSPAQAPAWGLARTIAMEQPGIWGGIVDLDPRSGDPDADAAAIANEILVPDGEDQVAYRAGSRLVARLARVVSDPADAAEEPPHLDPDAAYLITGGRGALGVRIAEWLRRRGARHLVLLGRRPMSDDDADTHDPQMLEAIRRLRENGATVYTPHGDVADPRAMSGFFDGSNAPWPTIRGVVHAAGLFEIKELKDIDWPSFRAMLRPKVEGTLVLDAAIEAAAKTAAEATGSAPGAPLDFFVSCSSAWSMFGSALTGHYVAASHFQDVFSHDRARRGLPTLSVDWGWWQEGSLAADNAGYFQATGFEPVADHLGFAALDRLVPASRAARGRAQVAVAPVNWDRLLPVFEARRHQPLFEDMAEANQNAAPSRGPGDEALLARLREADTPAIRARLIEDAVQVELAAVLSRPAGSRLDRDLGFFNAGMDSITSVELRDALARRLGIDIPATAAFEHPTVAALAEFLADELFGAADERTGEYTVAATGSSAEPSTDSPADPLAVSPPSPDLEGLSEDELLALLMQELGEA